MTNINDVITKKFLKICPSCGGTGVDRNDSGVLCKTCEGQRVVIHFAVEFNFEVPFYSEYSREKTSQEIKDRIAKLYEDLGAK